MRLPQCECHPKYSARIRLQLNARFMSKAQHRKSDVQMWTMFFPNIGCSFSCVVKFYVVDRKSSVCRKFEQGKCGERFFVISMGAMWLFTIDITIKEAFNHTPQLIVMTVVVHSVPGTRK